MLPVLQVIWSDWGSPQRLTETKRTIERRIQWAAQTQTLTFSAHGAAPAKAAEIVVPPRQGGLAVDSTG